MAMAHNFTGSSTGMQALLSSPRANLHEMATFASHGIHDSLHIFARAPRDFDLHAGGGDTVWGEQEHPGPVYPSVVLFVPGCRVRLEQ